MPYFMTNENWYRYEEGAENEFGSNYVLTEEGRKIPEVVESYNEFVENDSLEFDPDEEDKAMKLFGIKG